MKLTSFFAGLFLITSVAVAADVPKVSPANAAKRVAEGRAVLVDVREAAEWKESGVAAPAVLLAKSAFDADQKEWKDFLASVGDKEVIVYCRTGRRSEAVAGALAATGIKVANSGGMKDWADAGLPVRRIDGQK